MIVSTPKSYSRKVETVSYGTQLGQTNVFVATADVGETRQQPCLDTLEAASGQLLDPRAVPLDEIEAIRLVRCRRFSFTHAVQEAPTFCSTAHVSSDKERTC